jgi:hypothetical protein
MREPSILHLCVANFCRPRFKFRGRPPASTIALEFPDDHGTVPPCQPRRGTDTAAALLIEDQTMRNLLALAALILIVVGVYGYYQGWYNVEKTKTPDGNTTIKVTIDDKKVEDAIDRGKKNVSDIIHGK